MTSSSLRLALAGAVGFALVAPVTTLAQTTTPTTTTSPSATTTTAPMPMSTGTGTINSGNGGTMTSPAPSGNGANGSGNGTGNNGTNNGNGGQDRGNGTNNNDNANVKGKIKKIRSGSLSISQAVYGVTHPVEQAKKLKAMGTVNFDNLRVYKLPTSLKSRLKVGMLPGPVVAMNDLPIELAQTLPASNGSNSPIQYLRDVLANINVSNALNNLNVLNNSNVNLNVALSNVLNNNKITIGQVVGLYIGGGSIITTITK